MYAAVFAAITESVGSPDGPVLPILPVGPVTVLAAPVGPGAPVGPCDPSTGTQAEVPLSYAFNCGSMKNSRFLFLL